MRHMKPYNKWKYMAESITLIGAIHQVVSFSMLSSMSLSIILL